MMHQKNLDQARENIQKNFPQLEIKSINFIGAGMDSKAFLVNNNLIFRFPKHKEVVSQLKAEICLLPKLRPHVQFEIPNFEYVGQQQENRFPFVGYRKIQSVSLEKELLMKLDPGLQEKLIQEMADVVDP